MKQLLESQKSQYTVKKCLFYPGGRRADQVKIINLCNIIYLVNTERLVEKEQNSYVIIWGTILLAILVKTNTLYDNY